MGEYAPHSGPMKMPGIEIQVAKEQSSSLEIQHGGNHYKDLPIQPAEYCQKNRLNFCESCAIKYATRHKSKGGSEDLKKAIHFLQMALEMEYQIKSKVKYSDE